MRLRPSLARLVVALAAAGVTAGCRPDPGASRYDQQEPFPHDDGGGEALPGPFPYVPGARRLSVGAFYEGGASDVIPVDNMASNLYVYSDTVTLLPDPEHIEGKTSTRATHAGLTWWGFGVHWMMARDLGTWTHLHVSLRSADATFAAVDVGMNNANPVFVHAGRLRLRQRRRVAQPRHPGRRLRRRRPRRHAGRRAVRPQWRRRQRRREAAHRRRLLHRRLNGAEEVGADVAALLAVLPDKDRTRLGSLVGRVVKQV